MTSGRMTAGGVAVFLAALASVADVSAAGHPAAGKEKATKVCAACHGTDGNSAAATFPRLAGQHEAYLLHALQAYRSGGRNNEIMKAQVAGLSPGEMADLAAYFASQKGLEVKR